MANILPFQECLITLRLDNSQKSALVFPRRVCWAMLVMSFACSPRNYAWDIAGGPFRMPPPPPKFEPRRAANAEKMRDAAKLRKPNHRNAVTACASWHRFEESATMGLVCRYDYPLG